LTSTQPDHAVEEPVAERRYQCVRRLSDGGAYGALVDVDAPVVSTAGRKLFGKGSVFCEGVWGDISIFALGNKGLRDFIDGDSNVLKFDVGRCRLNCCFPWYGTL